MLLQDFYRIIKINDTKTKKKKKTQNKTNTFTIRVANTDDHFLFCFFFVRNVKKFNILFLPTACDVTRHDMQFLRVVIIFSSSFGPLKVFE